MGGIVAKPIQVIDDDPHEHDKAVGETDLAEENSPLGEGGAQVMDVDQAKLETDDVSHITKDGVVVAPVDHRVEHPPEALDSDEEESL